MGRSTVKVNTDELKAFVEQLKKVATRDFIAELAKDVAARYLRRVVKNTPVDQGNLRRSWDVEVKEMSNGYEITVKNSAEYASYVEYGHRQTPGRYVPAIGKRLKKSWVDGVFFVTKSELEMEAQLPRIIENKMNKWLKEVFG